MCLWLIHVNKGNLCVLGRWLKYTTLIGCHFEANKLVAYVIRCGTKGYNNYIECHEGHSIVHVMVMNHILLSFFLPWIIELIFACIWDSFTMWDRKVICLTLFNCAMERAERSCYLLPDIATVYNVVLFPYFGAWNIIDHNEIRKRIDCMKCMV